MPALPWPAFGAVDFARGRLFDTTDADEAHEVCGRVFNPHRLQVLGRGQQLVARMDHLPVGGVSINRLTWGAPVAVDPDRLGHYYLLSLPVAGNAAFHLGGRRHDVNPRCAALVNASERLHFEASAGFDQIVVRFERHAVEAAWAALAGAAPAKPIDFQVPVPVDGPAWRALAPVLAMLSEASGPTPRHAGLPHLHARLEDLLLTALLLQLGPTATAAPAAPHSGQVQRLQEHLLDRLEEPWTLAAAARAAGMATRTLQNAFQARCGQGPMQWLREQRLLAVHALLARGEVAHVTEAALRYGFTHLGEFACAYRRRFGETPRQTLARRH